MSGQNQDQKKKKERKADCSHSMYCTFGCHVCSHFYCSLSGLSRLGQTFSGVYCSNHRTSHSPLDLHRQYGWLKQKHTIASMDILQDREKKDEDKQS